MTKFDEIRNAQKEPETLPDIALKFPYGACKLCGEVTGELRVGRATILYCVTHKLYWSTPYLSRVAPNDQQLAEQREKWVALGMDEFSETHGLLPGQRERDAGSGKPA
jgi:hypothetical protein